MDRNKLWKPTNLVLLLVLLGHLLLHLLLDLLLYLLLGIWPLALEISQKPGEETGTLGPVLLRGSLSLKRK